MKNILIPTDFSENSWNALRYAIELYKNEAANFYLIHISDLKQSDVVGNSFVFPQEKDGVNIIKQKLNEIIDRIDSSPTHHKRHFFTIHGHGNFISNIKKIVSEKKIDLIALGTKGASGPRTCVIGSNTGDIITKIACNILAVPEKASICIPKNLLFPTDYTIFFSHPILESITGVLQLSKSRLQVLNVVRNKVILTQDQEDNRNYFHGYLDETFENEYRIHNTADKNIKTAIQQFVTANKVDMVIMVAKNLNFLQNLLFHSSIKQLGLHTTLPLLVLHE